MCWISCCACCSTRPAWVYVDNLYRIGNSGCRRAVTPAPLISSPGGPVLDADVETGAAITVGPVLKAESNAGTADAVAADTVSYTTATSGTLSTGSLSVAGLSGVAGTIKTQSTAANAASVATTATITVTPYATVS